MWEITMRDEILIQTIEADRRREEAAIQLSRAAERARHGSDPHAASVVRSARRAVGHGLIDLGLRVAAVHPAAGRRVVAGLPK